MIGASVTIKQGLVLQTLQRLQKPDRRRALESIGMLLVSKAKDNIAGQTGPNGPWPRSPLSELYAGPRIWRDIARSIRADLPTDDSLSVGPTHIAGAVRQLGTVGKGGTLPDIVPVKKKALTIPVSQAASRASYNGVDARSAFPDAFILKRDDARAGIGFKLASAVQASARNVGVIVRRVGGKTNKSTGEITGQKLEILYVLATGVAIRPHPYLPMDKAGNISPERLWDEIGEALVAAYVPPETSGGAA